MKNPIRVGTRGSTLARAQTLRIVDSLRQRFPQLEIKVKVVPTTGDRLSAKSLRELAGETKGLFVKEIEQALLDGQIDLAVHSLKDMPAEMAPGLCLGAVPQREDPRDAVVAHDPDTDSLERLPQGARVGTGSPRRRAQLKEVRPDLEIVEIRGNVDTRLEKVRRGEFDAVLLAAAGLNRLGLDSAVSFLLETELMTPAVGQGALAVQTREGDAELTPLLESLEDEASRSCVDTERWFLTQLGGGCQMPLGACARLRQEASFEAFWLRPGEAMGIRYRGSGSTLEQLASEALERFTLAGRRQT